MTHIPIPRELVERAPTLYGITGDIKDINTLLIPRSALTRQAEPAMPCGHHPSLMLHSAETGEPLYCELCDDKSGRKDAELRETELAEANRVLREELAAQPEGQEAVPLAPATEQQRLRDLADRIDHEQLWRRSPLDRFDGKMTPEQIDRMDAGVHLRRYSDLLQPGSWRVFRPGGVLSFRASTLDAAVAMARRDEERRAGPAGQAGGGNHA